MTEAKLRHCIIFFVVLISANMKQMKPLFLHLLQLQSFLFLIGVPTSFSSSFREASVTIAKHGCIDQCGKVKIPYPFGIGENCFRDAFYEIVCRNNNTPVLQYYSLEVTNIGWPHRFGSDLSLEQNNQTLTILTPATNACRNDAIGVRRLDFEGSPYRFSGLNDFMVSGCGGSVLLKSKSGEILTGCASLCSNSSSATSSEITTCFGVGCCHSTVKGSGLAAFDIEFDHTAAASSKTCTLSAGLINSHNSVKQIGNSTMFPTVLTWSVLNLTDEFIRTYTNSPVGDKIICVNSSRGEIFCSCYFMYEGNPYITDGCQVVQECQKCKLKNCNWNLDSDPTCYNCVNPLLQRGPVLGFSLGIGSVLLLISCCGIYRVFKNKREANRKAKYFKRNGGLLLQQHLSSDEGTFEQNRVFHVFELERATNNFNSNRILGQGGQGTVFKGMLTDGKIVAIKKSKLVDEGQLEHFINELVILSQINHRNVVKLLGCCLETEVPLLVYEFIPNGTLYHLLHNPSEDFQMTWKMRLQIAGESANALAYLHSSSATPIYHRDIKSSNILLDDKYRAKVSDFGTSRAITIEQTHVTTCVMGTYGYLDPEYFQTNQFTEKSDVYSFGVVLVELITGRKPICPTNSGGWIGLAYEFLYHMETSRLFEILDAQVLEEAKEDELIVVANLARQCLQMSGKLRPSMKEIAVVLDGIRSHELSNLKEVHHEETKCAVKEMTEVHCTSFKANTFCSDNWHRNSNSMDVQPLMHKTF